MCNDTHKKALVLGLSVVAVILAVGIPQIEPLRATHEAVDESVWAAVNTDNEGSAIGKKGYKLLRKTLPSPATATMGSQH